ncbi:MAG: response regulator [Candidatus Thorarchaeota archaeon]|jgi:CheY-like chemotaxis protein
MINSILLVDDENLFHLVFEDACSLLDITLSLESVSSADEAEKMFKAWQEDDTGKPNCVFVDLNIIGSTFDGIELIRRVNQKYGNGVVIGIISSSADSEEIERAALVGAQFWIVKSDEIEPRLEAFKADYSLYESRAKDFTVYK